MKNLIIRYGLLLFACFAGFFLLMYVLGFGDQMNLRFVNIGIHLVVLWFAIKDWARSHPVSLREYPTGIVSGMAVSVTGAVLFAVFVAFFLYTNQGLHQGIQSQLPQGFVLNPITIVSFIVMENIALSLFASYIYVRIMERRQMGTD